LIKTILVPIDGSDNSSRALDYALDNAMKYNSKVTIMNVIKETIFPILRTRDIIYDSPPKGYVEYSENLRNVRKILLDEALKHAQSTTNYKIEVDTILLEGYPAELILAESDAINADLIVIGSRGLGRVEGLLLGSVSGAVVMGSKIPVTIVK